MKPPEQPTTSPGAGAAPAHQPYVPAGVTNLPELTLPAVLVGAILGIIFGASSLYLVLKVGLTVSASIPIAVLSITLFRLFTPLLGRRATILENNIVQTTGSAGESIAFGTGVTMPAILILGHDLELMRVLLVAALGGVLGILMMIPLRRAFIVRQHGRLTYPEGTACADVLIVGERGGTSAATVFAGFGVGFIYWFVGEGLRLFRTVPERALAFFPGAVLSAEVAPHLLGVGYIIGTRISCIMVAGGILAAWILTPAIVFFGSGLSEPLYPGLKLVRDMSPGEIRNSYVIYVGAGAVAAAGIIAMFQALPMMIASIRMGLRDIRRRNAPDAPAGAAPGAGAAALPRIDRDLSMKVVLVGTLGLILAIRAAPYLEMNTLGALCIVLFGFLFVTVSSRLVGEIGSTSNPISGMTVATLLMTCLIFLLLGWTSGQHKLTALSVAGIVCVAASNAGATSQDLKTGFLVGATPRAQQIGILIGALSSAIVIGFTLLVLNDNGTVYTRRDLPATRLSIPADAPRERVRGHWAAQDPAEYFAVHVTAGQYPGVREGKYLVDADGTVRYLVDPAINGRIDRQDDGVPATKYDAPKTRLMASIIDGILTQQMPWTLVLLGVAITLVLELAGVASLPFAVGLYLPLYASTPIFAGGLVRWIVDRWLRRGRPETEMSPGVLLSSGLIAGGTIAGIVAALIQVNVNIARGPEWVGAAADSSGLALVPFGLLTLLLLLVAGEHLLRPGRRPAPPAD